MSIVLSLAGLVVFLACWVFGWAVLATWLKERELKGASSDDN